MVSYWINKNFSAYKCKNDGSKYIVYKAECGGWIFTPCNLSAYAAIGGTKYNWVSSKKLNVINTTAPCLPPTGFRKSFQASKTDDYWKPV